MAEEAPPRDTATSRRPVRHAEKPRRATHAEADAVARAVVDIIRALDERRVCL